MVVAAGVAIVVFGVAVFGLGYWRARKKAEEARQAEEGESPETRGAILCRWSMTGHPNLPALNLDK
jgi:hypothetical protein